LLDDRGIGRADGTVVAADVTVYRDLLAARLGARASTSDSVGDAKVVVLCPNGDGPRQVERVAERDRLVIVVGVAPEKALPYYEAGAFTVLPQSASVDELGDAVDRASRGECELSTQVAPFVLDRLRELRRDRPECLVARLTAREREVANLLAEGASNDEIARRLWITLSTVKKHVNRVFFKLGVRRRWEVGARLGG
jgi:DNA-binding NarL/FixJ family response regulator